MYFKIKVAFPTGDFSSPIEKYDFGGWGRVKVFTWNAKAKQKAPGDSQGQPETPGSVLRDLIPPV